MHLEASITIDRRNTRVETILFLDLLLLSLEPQALQGTHFDFALSNSIGNRLLSEPKN
jgi:hypothetical protein